MSLVFHSFCFSASICTSNAGDENSENGLFKNFELVDDLNATVAVSALSYPFLITDGSELCVFNLIEKTVIRDYSCKLKAIYSLGL